MPMRNGLATYSHNPVSKFVIQISVVLVNRFPDSHQKDLPEPYSRTVNLEERLVNSLYQSPLSALIGTHP